jgi:hypothetical protein
VKVQIYKTIILPHALYGCETLFLTLREKHRQWVFENRVLRRIFGPKWDDVTGEWKLHNEELNNLYSSPDITRKITSRRMRWAGIWDAWERREGRPMRRWDGIRKDLREISWRVWIGFDWLRTGKGDKLFRMQ